MAADVPLRTLLILFLSLACSSASREETRKLSYYKNGRFGVALDYPALLKSDEKSSANGDGRKFRDGAVSLTVYGSNDVLTPSETMSIMSHGDVLYTYKRQLPDGLVLSGIQGENIIYQRCKRRAEVLGCFEIVYPNDRRLFWDQAVTQMSRSLEVNPP